MSAITNSLTTTHKGKEIRFSEHTETWDCGDLNLSDPSLPKLRKKIDTALRRARSNAAYACLLMPSPYLSSAGGEVKPVAATVTEYLGTEKNYKKVEQHKVAVMAVYMGQKKTRQKKGLGDVIHDTDHNRCVLAEMARLQEVYNTTAKLYTEQAKLLTRVNMDDLTDLVEVSGMEAREEIST